MIWSHVPNDFLLELLQLCINQTKRYSSALNLSLADSKTLSRSITLHKEIARALKLKEKRKLRMLGREYWTPPLP